MPLEDKSEIEEFNEKIKSLNEVICNPELLKEKYMDKLGKSKEHFLSVLEPYNSRIMCSLFSRGLLPSFLGEKRKLQILNWIECESHNEKFLFALK